MAKDLGLAGHATFLAGDIRRVGKILPAHEGTFQVVLNLFTSLGYWDDATDLDLLGQLHSLAAPGAILIVDTINRDYLLKHFEPHGQEAFGDLVYLEERSFNYETSRLEARWSFYIRKGEDMQHRATVNVSTRAYAAHELLRLITEAGWSQVKVYGGWALGNVSPDVYRMMTVARA